MRGISRQSRTEVDTMILFVYITLTAIAVYGSDVRTYVFDDTSGVGRRFDGIGGLSGGGATSKLLVNYPEEQRNQILDFLFKPGFGASLHILKVEIGGDVQSTDGTEASHMHNNWDENYERGYEWWLMKEAKKRNPNIKLYGLPWGFPGWIAEEPNDPYANPMQTATYILKWIQGAKTYHNLTIDLVGIWNEHDYDVTYIKTLRKVLDNNQFSNVKIVAADGKWDISKDIMRDKELADAVEYIGAHYPGTVSDSVSIQTGKQLWASEDYSTYNDFVGAACLARIMNQNYVNGRMTSTISWNLIASYYKDLIHYREGLMTAVEPWSGHYAVESPIWITAHTTQFTDIGWTYLNHGEGVGHFETGGSYVGLLSPDKKDLTIVFETMTHNHSVCIRPPLEPFNVTPAQINIQLKGNLANIQELQVWYTKLTYESGDKPAIFKKKDPLQLTNGQATVSLGVDEVWTLTTLTRGNKGKYPLSPASKDFPLPYTEDFEGYEVAQEPYNISPQLGSFEVVAENNNKFLRQTVLQQPLPWCNSKWDHNLNRSLSVIGEHHWQNVSIQADIRQSAVNGSKGILLAARIDQVGCHANDSRGVFFYVFPSDNFYILSKDAGRTEVIDSGHFMYKTRPGWNTFELKLYSIVAFGYVNGQWAMQTVVDSSFDHMGKGFVGIGTDNWGLADFDNIVIKESARP